MYKDYLDLMLLNLVAAFFLHGIRRGLDSRLPIHEVVAVEQ